MDKRADLKKHFETLELSIDAAPSEINNAYTSLKKLYSSNSIVLSPLIGEFTEEKRTNILKDIDNAYKNLSVLHIKEEPTIKSECVTEVTPEVNNEFEEKYDGSMLRDVRLSKNIDLKEVADHTNISKSYLLNIENENFDELPARIYLKGFIVSYAKYLGLDAEKLANSIIEKFEIWKEPGKDDKLE